MDLLLCTDLDGTVLGDPEGEARFRAWMASMRGAIVVAYVTGRNLRSVRSLVADGRLLLPDLAVCEVGTQMLDLRDPGNRLGRDFEALADPTWPADEIRARGQGDRTPLQPPDGQGRFKASFFWDGDDRDLAELCARLGGIDDLRLIATARAYLDVVPRCYGKEHAVRFLAERLGYPLERVLVAGDSENDADMFRLGARSIVPCNARPAAIDAACSGVHFLSRLARADGVLEGLRHFGAVRG